MIEFIVHLFMMTLDWCTPPVPQYVQNMMSRWVDWLLHSTESQAM